MQTRLYDLELVDTHMTSAAAERSLIRESSMTINWQKIETAPKDGTRVLLMRTKKLDNPSLPDILWIKVGKWYGHWQNAYFKAWREDSLAAGWDTGMIPLAPTHWAALPEISEDMLMER